MRDVSEMSPSDNWLRMSKKTPSSFDGDGTGSCGGTPFVQRIQILEMGLGDSSYPTKRSGWWVLIFEPKSKMYCFRSPRA